jgi:hypothetical protein
MSIWSSVGAGGPEILALENDGDAANYRGEGEPTIAVDVATTGHHELIRLALWRDEQPAVDMDVLLTRDAAAQIRDRLTTALERHA